MKRMFMLLTILVLTIVLLGISCSSQTPATTGAQTSQPVTINPGTSLPATSPASQVTALSPNATSTPTGPQPKYGGTFKIIYDVGPGGPFGWPPDIVGESGVPAQLCLEGPLRQLLDGSVIPWLATSWELAQDKKSITFHLRQGIKFHDGSDFNAQAVKLTYDGDIEAKLQPYWASVEVIDDYTVKINFKEWRNTLLAGFEAYVASAESYQKNGRAWADVNPVGTGPFIYKEFVRDVSFKAVRNPKYWQPGKPYLDAVQYLYIADPQTRLAAMQANAGDAMVVGLKKEAADLKNAGFKVITQVQAINSLVPDSANPDSPYANQKVREALEYAIDKEAIASGLGYGMWQAPYQIVPRSNSAWDPNFGPVRKYDPAKAKQLLAEAGYPNGFKTTIIPSPTASFNLDVCVAIQSYLDKVGIKAEIQVVEYAKYLTYRNGAWKNALLIEPMASWANYNQTLAAYFTPNTTTLASLKKSDEFLALFNASLQSTEPDVTLIRQVVKQIYDEAMVITVYEGGKGYGVWDYVQNPGFITRGFPTYWTPENAWLSK